jgi:H+-transporting ATPase
VLLAILNDAAILTIAYDRVRPSARPERWELNEVLSVATILGLVGVVSSLGIVWIGSSALDLADAGVRTLVYLKLSVAGHLTLFVVRTRGAFWTRPLPAPIMLVAVIGTQILATVIALTGFLMEPLEWSHALIVWGYALVWFLLLDRVKLLAYRVLERRAARRAARAIG